MRPLSSLPTLFLRLLCGACLLPLFPGCATFGPEPQPAPETVIYFIDRTNYDGGDNGYAVPIATCDEGTVFTCFPSRHRLELPVLAELGRIDTGEGPLPRWVIPAQSLGGRDWPGGHRPHLVCYPVQVPTVPLFVDDKALGELPDARLEGDEAQSYNRPGNEGKHFPGIRWERLPLRTGQFRSPLRVDAPGVKNRNGGDSGVPRFAILPDGTLAFLTTEIYKHGGGASTLVYLDMLRRARDQHPSVEWREVRWPAAE